MNDAAAPPREEVRSHKVVGTLRGLKSGLDTLRVINEASQANDNDKASTSGSGEGPTLKLLFNGKTRLEYSVERHTEYRRSEEERATDPSLFGFTETGWIQTLSAHGPIKQAYAQNSYQKDLLDQVVKERLLYDLRTSGVRADLLNVSGTAKYMTRWETVAVCALLNIPNLQMVDKSGKDLGRGIFRLGEEFSHIEMAVLPHYDHSSPYTAKAAMRFGGEYGRYQFLIVYKNVTSDDEFRALRNACQSRYRARIRLPSL